MKCIKVYLMIFLTLIFLESCNENKSSQDKKHISSPNFLESRLYKADSIILVSHDDSYRNIGEGISAPNDSFSLIFQDKLNLPIIHEYVKISVDDELINLLTQKSADSLIYNYTCFLPHHAILVYKENKISYLDVSFECKGWETSNDSLFEGVYLSDQGLLNLRKYFHNKGIKYFPCP